MTAAFLSLLLVALGPSSVAQTDPGDPAPTGEESTESSSPAPGESSSLPADEENAANETEPIQKPAAKKLQPAPYHMGPADLPVPPSSLSPVDPNDLQGEVNRLRAQQESMQKQMQMLASR
ncbi:MAG: hypothetical protein KDD43_13820, partial [Bdellovibrionales bacterium]|nr:hypothetical protein [Bdellovibrionales bacterium]